MLLEIGIIIFLFYITFCVQKDSNKLLGKLKLVLLNFISLIYSCKILIYIIL